MPNQKTGAMPICICPMAEYLGLFFLKLKKRVRECGLCVAKKLIT